MRFLIGLSLSLLALAAVPARAAEVWSPARGSPERARILDAARPVFEREVGGPVEFVVTTLNVMDGWAYGDVRLQRPGGTPIDWRRTPFADSFREGVLETEHNLFLLAWRDGAWTPVEHAIGPTDVAWDWWRQQRGLPAELFGASAADFPPVETQQPRPRSGN